MEASKLKKVKQLEEGNVKLKRIYAELALEVDMTKYVIKKSSKTLCQAKTCTRVERTISKGHQQGVRIFKTNRSSLSDESFKDDQMLMNELQRSSS